jgi:hypothetical protein
MTQLASALQPEFAHRGCDWCGEPFYLGRVDHRFCCIECNRLWHVDERRKALAFWRSLPTREPAHDR